MSPKLHCAPPKLRDGEGGSTSFAPRRAPEAGAYGEGTRRSVAEAKERKRQAFGGRWKAMRAGIQMKACEGFNSVLVCVSGLLRRFLKQQNVSG